MCVYGHPTDPSFQPPTLTFFICNSTLTLLATLSIFTQNSENHFCCLISSNVLFIQPLAFCRNCEQRRQKNCVTHHKTASTNDGLSEISKMKYRIQEPGTTISGFSDSKKKINANRSQIFLTCGSKHTFFLDLSSFTYNQSFSVEFFVQPKYTDYANQAYFDKRSHLNLL